MTTVVSQWPFALSLPPLLPAEGDIVYRAGTGRVSRRQLYFISLFSLSLSISSSCVRDGKMTWRSLFCSVLFWPSSPLPISPKCVDGRDHPVTSLGEARPSLADWTWPWLRCMEYIHILGGPRSSVQSFFVLPSLLLIMADVIVMQLTVAGSPLCDISDDKNTCMHPRDGSTVINFPVHGKAAERYHCWQGKLQETTGWMAISLQFLFMTLRNSQTLRLKEQRLFRSWKEIRQNSKFSCFFQDQNAASVPQGVVPFRLIDLFVFFPLAALLLSATFFTPLRT